MFSIILIIVLVALIAAMTVYIHRHPYDELPKKEGEDCDNNCGTCVDVCASSKILKAQVAKEKYFNDEELDDLAGISSDGYSEEQIDLFRSIFDTLRPEEIVEWVESLRRRGIELPNSLKDEVFLMINDD